MKLRCEATTLCIDSPYQLLKVSVCVISKAKVIKLLNVFFVQCTIASQLKKVILQRPSIVSQLATPQIVRIFCVYRIQSKYTITLRLVTSLLNSLLSLSLSATFLVKSVSNTCSQLSIYYIVTNSNITQSKLQRSCTNKLMSMLK